MEERCQKCNELWSPADDNDQVCCLCGYVVDDPSLCSEIPYHILQGRRPNAFACNSRAGAILSKKTRLRIGLAYGLQSLSNLCHIYNIPGEKRTEMQDLLNKVYEVGRGYRYKEDVGVLAGCCVFLIQRRNKQAIPLAAICNQLGCTKAKFSSILKYLKSWLSKNNRKDLLLPKEDALVINTSVLPEVAKPLIQVLCENAPEGERDKMVQKTSELVKLSYSCWLFTGRLPRGIVIACAFLCWKSLNASRKTKSFDEFCYVFKVQEPEPVAKKRVGELLKLLLKLGQKIPSYSSNYVNKDNILFHLDTILKNSETLRNDLLEDELSEEGINSKEYAAFRIIHKTKPRVVATTSVVYESDMNASDIEISDTEIESYIIRDKLKEEIEDVCEKTSPIFLFHNLSGTSNAPNEM